MGGWLVCLPSQPPFPLAGGLCLTHTNTRVLYAGGGHKPEVIDEGLEPDSFWQMLGGKVDYPSGTLVKGGVT